VANETKYPFISVMKHIETNFTLAVDYPGEDFDSTAQNEWIQPRLLGYVPAPTRLSQRMEDWLLNINTFVKTEEVTAPINRSWEIIDLVLAQFDQATIAVKDWGQASPEPTLYQMRFSEGSVSPFPQTGERPLETQGLQQFTASFDGWIIT